MDIAAKEGVYSLAIYAPSNECRYKVYRKSDNQLVAEGVCQPNDAIVINSPVDTIMEVDNKYAITKIVVNQNRNAWFEFADLVYISNLASLALFPYPGLKNIAGQDIAELAPLTKLTLLSVQGHGYIKGTIEDYVIQARQKGRTADLTAMLIDTGVTFNGVDVYSALGGKLANIYLDFTTTPGSCMVRDGSISGHILGTYNGQSWQYS